MTVEEKKDLIDAVNCKYPRQNLTEIYYNIGRALPFTAQRFPDGRVSDWYRNQYIEVVKVEPHGKQGKFGKVYGFYYRNGVREDAVENDPENSWCKKDTIDPQPIPCSGCGSWSLIDIVGDKTARSVNVLGLDDSLDFGKYKGMSLKDVILKDWQYIKWAIWDSAHLYTNADKVFEYYMEHRPTLGPNDILNFGKYKGKTIRDIYTTDAQYLMWLSQNNDSLNIDWESIKHE